MQNVLGVSLLSDLYFQPITIFVSLAFLSNNIIIIIIKQLIMRHNVNSSTKWNH